MITTFADAVYQALSESAALAGVTIIDNAMQLVGSGGIAVQPENESYAGGSENRRDWCSGQVRVNCVAWIDKRDYKAASDAADALAKLARQALKANLTLVSQEYPSGLNGNPVRILRTELGFGEHGGTETAIAAVVVQANYEESYE